MKSLILVARVGIIDTQYTTTVITTVATPRRENVSTEPYDGTCYMGLFCGKSQDIGWFAEEQELTAAHQADEERVRCKNCDINVESDVTHNFRYDPSVTDEYCDGGQDEGEAGDKI
ncbi:hypothetical protein ACHWQZ_G003579 [Mnemiopsis leidyi]